ncbi:UvrD-helicase domain-containing protein [Pedobacter psychrodurus]|uniref:UvrD-helicase domain-containing protein n=1 Tax=Pedobacter psychrodurus TaxID=2530456 RepID=UPI00292FD20E|nr:UvrD-helicase domain-containing protein [Pedobacter psychrodurus]
MNKQRGPSDAVKILLFILTFGAWYLYYRWHKRMEDKQELIALLPAIEKAALDFGPYLDGSRYFAHYDYRQLSAAHQHLLSRIPKHYARYGLTTQEFKIVDRFASLHRDIEKYRTDYNQAFTRSEIDHYQTFFSRLEKYPLSQQQMQAVVSEEDNNLVIAGAGTGKTTTVSAKIAYLLRKKLALPEDILVISFTNTAVEEMYERTLRFCGKGSGVENINFRTFNSFGNQVVRYCNPHPKTIAFDGKDYRAKAFLQERFDAMFLQDEDFQSKATNFLAFFNRPVKDDFEFNSAAEYERHLESQRNISLDGQEVKSFEELQIANFLYLHQVNYEYESLFPLEREDRNPDFQHYAPDFYLPGYDIYHEHYGIDENGDVPAWFSYRAPFTSAREYYHHGIQWKEGIHKKYKTRLLRTHSYQNRNGTLLRSLKQQLTTMGVVMNKRDPKEILGRFKKSGQVDGFIGLIYSFLNLMKSAGTFPTELRSKETELRFAVFLDVFTPLYQGYEQELKKKGSIDFNDMVNLATGYINKGTFSKHYKYILVDEFQDMSQGRYKLLTALKSANPAAKLYAVGDDWQSVYRFNGSDISIITHFSEHFGATAHNSVLETYRFNTEILSVSSSFIQKNPAQLRKQLSSPFDATFPAFALVPLTYRRMKKAEADLYRFDRIDEILARIPKSTARKNIFLIGRYRHNSPPDLAVLQKKHPTFRLTYHTAHSSKGLTCDHAILLDVDSGIFGFPSEIADDPVLDYLLRDGGSYENAEERRLFYVALTRARHQVFLLYNKSRPSKFVRELRKDYGLETIGELKID